MIQLPESDVELGTIAEVAGWGLYRFIEKPDMSRVSSTLQKCELRVIDNQICQRLYGPHYPILTYHLCASIFKTMCKTYFVSLLLM